MDKENFLFELLAIGALVYVIERKGVDRLKKIQKTLDEVLKTVSAMTEASSVEFYFNNNGQLTRVTMAQIKVTEKRVVSVKFKDKFGNDAKVDGKPNWSVTDPAAAGLEISEDGMSATLSPLGPLTPFEVQLSADALIGEGEKAITGSLPIEPQAGDAETVELALGPAL